MGSRGAGGGGAELISIHTLPSHERQGSDPQGWPTANRSNYEGSVVVVQAAHHQKVSAFGRSFRLEAICGISLE